MYKLYMEFEKPVQEFLGRERTIQNVKYTVQGFAVHKNTGFVLYHSGVGAAYDLCTKEKKPLGVFKLGSYNEGEPDNRWANHANDAMFGGFLPGETFPRLYVTAGNSVESDEHGYIAYCAVEQIRCQDGVYSSETVQRIYYKNDGIENSGYRTPGFGWPMSLVDADGGWYYMFSARYRTRKECAHIITKFPLPDPGAGDIILYPKDIVEQFELPFNVFFTQGGTLKDGRIWYMFGCGKDQHPNAMRVIDLKRREYVLCEDLSQTEFGKDEVECCAFFGDRLLINTQSGKLYEYLPDDISV